MAVAHEESVTSSASSDLSPTVTLPSTINADDLLLLVLSMNDTTGDLDGGAPDGWTQLLTTQSGSQHAAVMLYRVAAGMEGASVELTLNSFRTWTAVASRFSGVATSDPIGDVDVTGATSSTKVSPALVTEADGSAVVLALAARNDADLADNVAGYVLADTVRVVSQGVTAIWYD
jgi:hypothetical protein